MTRPDISIISSGASLADARLHRIANALIRNGLIVEILAPGNSSDAPSGAVVRSVNQGKGFQWRMHRAFYSPWRAQGKVLYCLAPEAQLFTKTASKFRGRIYCADIYEDYARLLKDRKWAKRYFGIAGLIGAAITRISTESAARAAVTSVADIQVPPFNARQRIILRNLPDSSNLTPSGDLSKQPRAIYIGDVRESRGLHTMLQSAELVPNWHIDIVGPISDHDSAWIHLWSISHEDAASRVTFHGRLSPTKSWALAEGAWVGLSLLEPTPAFIAAIPSKLYEYMAVGLATISTPLPRCAELIAKSGAGEIADGPESVAKILKQWEENPALIKKVRKSALEWASNNLDSDAEYGAIVRAIREELNDRNDQ